ncbi:hypothetical protein TpMuguga_03g00899 [Theileria parva strain Muguga]|uniref:uncharacterized protein n=1 Tax=Theileria parva strain Muguga TaxID=333668 RepID=UPI001C61EC58|nr:uncharacterized protein TpMuguga_03g00899 [Theileria parva strain Muguga]EAN31201.2 hypothetical protein TpMuguga_03g00899 [Theileria parva strain Muguga]
MTSIITILIIELIECVFGINYVDVKNYNISLGVNVFHGRFDKDCKYFMFVGDLEPITQLRFGNELIFPNDTGSNNYNLFVEMFIKNNIKLVSFYVHTFHKGLLKEVKRKVISISCDTYSYIGPRPKHPFINRMISEHDNSCVETYYIYGYYKDFTLDGKSGPRYSFGYVYDSGHPVVVGYTKYPYIIDECETFYLRKRIFTYNHPTQLISEPFMTEFRISNKYKYELRSILGIKYWFLKQYNDELLLNQAYRNSIKFYKIYVNHAGIPLVTLDISELVTPKIFGLEKVTGSMANNWTYKLYKLKKEYESDCIIRMVIDSRIDNRNRVVFFQRHGNTSYDIEVYENNEQKYIFDYYRPKTEDSMIKKLKIYTKKDKQNKFKKIKNKEHKNTVKMMKKCHPIKLDVTVDEEQPSLFKKKEISNKELTIHHFSINETNDFGESILNKYVFGRVFRTTSFELGNIPQEPFRKHRVMIVGDINTNKFIVRNKSTLDNLNTPQYQLFRLRI